MDYTSLITEEILESSKVKGKMIGSCEKDIDVTVNKVIQALVDGGKVMWCGNGGSASQAQHLSTELVGGLNSHSRPGFSSISLATDVSFITAWSNDTSYDTIFSRQVQSLGQRKDVLIGISTSGNSKNVIEAVKICKKLGIISVTLTGSGGKLKQMGDFNISIPSTETQRIQECHILVGHIICRHVEEYFLKENNW